MNARMNLIHSMSRFLLKLKLTGISNNSWIFQKLGMASFTITFGTTSVLHVCCIQKLLYIGFGSLKGIQGSLLTGRDPRIARRSVIHSRIVTPLMASRTDHLNKLQLRLSCRIQLTPARRAPVSSWRTCKKRISLSSGQSVHHRAGVFRWVKRRNETANPN